MYLDLGRTSKVADVKVMATAGYVAEIYVADRPGADLQSWGPRRSGPGSGTFSLGGASGRYVLVWFTSLPEIDGSYKVEVSEISVDYS